MYSSPAPLDYFYNRLQDKVVFVTGASSGIGKAAVRLFAKEGATVVAAARRLDLLDSLAADLSKEGLNIHSVYCDVLEEDSVKITIEQIMSKFGRLDCAFNNAGAGSAGARGPIHEMETCHFDRLINTNLRGVFLCLKYECAAMLKSGGGSIVNTSSIGGLIGIPSNSMYAASKFGLTGLTKCAALDYARKRIRVNAIAPGATYSEMFNKWISTKEAQIAMAESFPMNYIALPDDMARAALFLLTEESRWCTGIILPCEGGKSA